MKIKRAKLFKKQYSACSKRGFNMDLLDAAIVAIGKNDRESLAAQSDHGLKEAYKGDRERHVGGAVRYNIGGDRLTLLLLATGTHREVLGIE